MLYCSSGHQLAQSIAPSFLGMDRWNCDKCYASIPSGKPCWNCTQGHSYALCNKCST